MPVIVDPDNLDRFESIIGTASQKVSLYPVGTTQRFTSVTVHDVWVETTGTLERTGASKDWNTDGGVVVGDVVCIMNSVNAGHYYVQAESVNTLTLADVDDGTGGAATTNLTLGEHTFDGVSDVDPAGGSDGGVITITAHGYNTGDVVVYDTNSLSTVVGLTDGTRYFIIRIDANDVELATTRTNALAGTAVDITADGAAGNHSIHDALSVAVFTNGASTSEQINGNDTSGDGTGSLLDGVTLQAKYSYQKEEWRVDSIANDDFNANYDADDYYDDLIRHEFPLESITSEQFEIGGGTAHADWTWFNDYTIKKVRTGGWADRITAGTTSFEYTGIITLGSVDTDSQVYYQQTSVITTPVNFTFLGVVNEPILTFTNPTPDNRGFLKLFVRKKARTYAQSEIADIGVTTIQTIVNRFPLSHVVDAAITANDGNLLGITPWRNGHDVTGADAIDGAKTISTLVFDDADATFQTDGIVAEDTLQITSGTEQGYYTIGSVGSEIALTIATDAEFTSAGWASSESSLTYSIFSYFRVAAKATGTASDITSAGASNGIIETGTPGIGTMTDTTGGFFLGAGAGNDAVVAGDYLFLTGTAAGNDGLYKVLDSGTSGASDPTTTVIYVDTSDQPFPGSLEGTVDYKVYTDGMYLQFKEVAVTNAAPTSYAFDDQDATYNNRPSITRSDGTFDASIDAGTMIEITGAEDTANNGRYTVFARETATILSLVAPTLNPDVLVLNATDTTAVITVTQGFERTIGSDVNGSIFSFRWRVWGNDSTLANIFQFVQHQLRQTTDIDFGDGTNRGDITDLLMAFSTPTGTTFDTIIDDLATADINNATFQDHSASARNFPFTAAGTLNFNDNLVNDSGPAKYWLFFTNDNAGDNLGRDYSTKNAIIVEDATSPTPLQIQGNITGATVGFTYDYDGNVQRGSASAGLDAPVTLVAIGLATAQFVIAAGTITRSTAVSITATAALERNYANPV